MVACYTSCLGENIPEYRKMRKKIEIPALVDEGRCAC